MSHHYLSLCMLRESAGELGSPRYSIANHNRHSIDRGLHYIKTLIVRHIRQGWTIRIINRTIRGTLQSGYVWMEIG